MQCEWGDQQGPDLTAAHIGYPVQFYLHPPIPPNRAEAFKIHTHTHTCTSKITTQLSCFPSTHPIHAHIHIPTAQNPRPKGEHATTNPLLLTLRPTYLENHHAALVIPGPGAVRRRLPVLVHQEGVGACGWCWWWVYICVCVCMYIHT